MSVPLKQRLLGVIVLVSIFVVVVPALLEDGVKAPAPLTSEIPLPPALPKQVSTIVLNPVEPEVVQSDEQDTPILDDESSDLENPSDNVTDDTSSPDSEKIVPKSEDAPVAAASSQNHDTKPTLANTSKTAPNSVVIDKKSNNHTEESVSKNNLVTTKTPTVVEKKTEVKTPIVAPNTYKEAAWILQLASFKSDTNAKRLVAKLRAENYIAFFNKNQNDGIYRVYVGPELDKALLDKQLIKIEQSYKIKGYVKRYNPADF